ncbi:MAG: ABC transporter permease [Thermoproteota archaeon]|nr:ABC transporter permease [Candidatus Brockarchaeota archaeon]
MTLRSYVVSRILLTIPMIFILLTIVFIIVRVLPGDPVLLHFEKMENPRAMEEMRQKLGLDKPIWIQYFDYLFNLLRGDLGKSMQDYSPVASQILSAFPATLELAIFSMIIAVSIGIILGVESSKSYNKPKDHIVRIFGIVTYAIPVFFLGMIFQIVFGVGLRWLPVGGRIYPTMEPSGLRIPLSQPPGGFATHLLLSCVAGLVAVMMCVVALKIRGQKTTRKTLGLLVSLFLTVWILWALAGWRFITLGELRISTGLYTVDSLLEGNPYKFVEALRYLCLPSLTLGLVISGVFIRLTRSNMLETLRLDFVTAAKARGLKEITVTYGYAFRNAFLPILTMMGLQFATLLAGAVLTETTFSWPGLGRYIVDRINFRDYTAIQGAVVFYGILVSLVSLVVDLLYAYFDPRIRL